MHLLLMRPFGCVECKHMHETLNALALLRSLVQRRHSVRRGRA